MNILSSRGLHVALSTPLGAMPLMATSVASSMLGYTEFFRHGVSAIGDTKLVATPKQFALLSTYGAIPVTLATSAITALVRTHPHEDEPERLRDQMVEQWLYCACVSLFPFSNMGVSGFAALFGATIVGYRGDNVGNAFSVGVVGAATFSASVLAVMLALSCLGGCVPAGKPTTWFSRAQARDLEASRQLPHGSFAPRRTSVAAVEPAPAAPIGDTSVGLRRPEALPPPPKAVPARPRAARTERTGQTNRSGRNHGVNRHDRPSRTDRAARAHRAARTESSRRVHDNLASSMLLTSAVTSMTVAASATSATTMC